MANQLKADPTRTLTLRRTFTNDMKRRFREVDKAHKELIVKDDAFGLEPGIKTLGFNVYSRVLTFEEIAELYNQPLENQERQAFRFLSDKGKLDAYKQWLQVRIDAEILEVDAVGQPWTGKYIQSAYRKGVTRSYIEMNKAKLLAEPSIFAGGRAQFLQQVFSSPIAIGKIELLSTRAFSELKGITDAMSQQLSRIVANGLLQGSGPSAIAKLISERIGAISRQRAEVLARTEVIQAHAEGQLDAFESLGVTHVGVLAEWVTAGDDRVCPLCNPLEGVVMTIKEARGLIPRHPNCRCMWLPASKEEEEKGQLRTPAQKRAAFRKSIRAERPKKTLTEARDRSVWFGKQLSTKR